MRFQVGKCYRITLHGETKEFRVIKNENNVIVTVRYCGSDEEDLLSHILMGDLSGIEVSEMNGLECDGKPSL